MCEWCIKNPNKWTCTNCSATGYTYSTADLGTATVNWTSEFKKEEKQVIV